MEQPLIEITADGSPTLYLPKMDEHYHSVKGALAESLHVFIQTGFRHSILCPLTIFEVGFGTGLNAFLTLLESETSQRKVTYYTIELYPLSTEQVNMLQYPQIIAPENTFYFEAIHQAEWNTPIKISPYFTIHKIKGDLTRISLPSESFGLIYYDAFAPEKQPDMWSEEIFSKISDAMSPEVYLQPTVQKVKYGADYNNPGLQ